MSLINDQDNQFNHDTNKIDERAFYVDNLSLIIVMNINLRVNAFKFIRQQY